MLPTKRRLVWGHKRRLSYTSNWLIVHQLGVEHLLGCPSFPMCTICTADHLPRLAHIRMARFLRTDLPRAHHSLKETIPEHSFVDKLHCKLVSTSTWSMHRSICPGIEWFCWVQHHNWPQSRPSARHGRFVCTAHLQQNLNNNECVFVNSIKFYCYHRRNRSRYHRRSHDRYRMNILRKICIQSKMPNKQFGIYYNTIWNVVVGSSGFSHRSFVSLSIPLNSRSRQRTRVNSFPCCVKARYFHFDPK